MQWLTCPCICILERNGSHNLKLVVKARALKLLSSQYIIRRTLWPVITWCVSNKKLGGCKIW